jgi:Ca2+-binding RTX toxin-like protein
MTIFGLQVSTGYTLDGSGEHDGAFRIYGGSAGDTITGSSNADWIFGSGGADTLRGGPGGDTFYYDDVSQSTPAAGDTILDFAAGDRIDVSGIDAINGGANDAFTFLGGAAFTNHAGELRAVNTGGNNWLVQGDTNGDGVADFQLSFVNSDAHPITSADFTL